MSDVLCGDLSDSFRVLFLQDFSKGIPATEHSPVLSGRSPAGENVLHYTHTHTRMVSVNCHKLFCLYGQLTCPSSAYSAELF